MDRTDEPDAPLARRRLFDDRRGAIGAAIIDNNQLRLNREPIERRNYLRNRLSNPWLFIEGGNYY
jgi:hypothetical protein